MPAYFHREQEAAQRGDFDRSICVSKKPYFMKYRYHDLSKQYSSFIKMAKYDCIVNFHISLENLLAKKQYNEREQDFIGWMNKNSPVSLGNCTMNRLCRIVESKLDGVQNKWKKTGSGFNYSIYRTTHKHPGGEAYIKIDEILTRYEKELKELPAFAKANRMSEAAIAEYRQSLAELVREECYCNCSSSEDLCSIILDLTYGSHKPSDMAWAICGDVIVENLLRQNDYTVNYYEKADDGEIEYKGMRFTKKCVRMEETEDRYSE